MQFIPEEVSCKKEIKLAYIIDGNRKAPEGAIKSIRGSLKHQPFKAARRNR